MLSELICHARVLRPETGKRDVVAESPCGYLP